MEKMKKYWWVIALVILLAVGVWYYMSMKKDSEKVPPPSPSAKKLTPDEVNIWRGQNKQAIDALVSAFNAKTGQFADITDKGGTKSTQSEMYKKFADRISQGATIEQVAVLEQTFLDKAYRAKNNKPELDYTEIFVSYNVPESFYKTL